MHITQETKRLKYIDMMGVGRSVTCEGLLAISVHVLKERSNHVEKQI